MSLLATVIRCTLALIMGAGCGNFASAEVVRVVLSPPIAVGDSWQPTGFDVTGDSIPDLRLSWLGASANAGMGWDAVLSADGGLLNRGVDANGRKVLVRLAQGEWIGPFRTNELSRPGDLVWAAYISNADRSSGGMFLATGSSRGFVGFAVGQGDRRHWGWAEISVDPSDGSNGALYLHSIGCESEPETALPVGPPLMLDLQRFGNQLTLSWSSVVGWSYQLQACEDLRSGRWADVGGTVPASGETTSLAEGIDVESVARFYRIQVLPSPR